MTLTKTEAIGLMLSSIIISTSICYFIYEVII